MNTILTAPDIVCDGCANAIKRAVAALSGVDIVEVNIETKTIAVTHDATVARENVVKVLDRAGFPVSGLS